MSEGNCPSTCIATHTCLYAQSPPVSTIHPLGYTAVNRYSLPTTTPPPTPEKPFARFTPRSHNQIIDEEKSNGASLPRARLVVSLFFSFEIHQTSTQSKRRVPHHIHAQYANKTHTRGFILIVNLRMLESTGCLSW